MADGLAAWPSWPSPRASDALALRPERGLGAVGHADLAEDAGQMGLDRLLADLQTAGDELVREPLEQEGEDLQLAAGEFPEGIGLGAGVEDRPGRARVE